MLWKYAILKIIHLLKVDEYLVYNVKNNINKKFNFTNPMLAKLKLCPLTGSLFV